MEPSFDLRKQGGPRSRTTRIHASKRSWQTISRIAFDFGERIKGSFGIQPDTLGLMFSTWTAEGKRKNGSSKFLSRIEFIESSGFVFVAGVSGYSGSSNMILFSENAFPRRDSSLQMRCYEEQTDRLLFDVKFPNPFYAPNFTEWVPETIPATRTVAPLTVTLKHGPAEIPHPYLRDEDLEIQSTDPRWTNTRPNRHFWLTDATGNRTYRLDGLSPFEPAWKIGLCIRRHPQAEFGSDEVWRTGRFSVPAALSAERLNLKREIAGVELGVSMLSSCGIVSDEGDALTMSPTEQSGRGTSFDSGILKGRAYSRIHSGLPFFHVTNSTVDSDTELIMTVRDQSGTKISVENGITYGRNGGGSFRVIQFEPTPESCEIELEIIVNRGRTFEFLVAPRSPASTLPAEVPKGSIDP